MNLELQRQFDELQPWEKRRFTTNGITFDCDLKNIVQQEALYPDWPLETFLSSINLCITLLVGISSHPIQSNPIVAVLLRSNTLIRSIV